MALSFTTTLRNNRLDQITTAVGSNALIRIYSGTPPANVGTALAGNTQLAELACSATFAPGASGGVLTLNAISNDTSADASGTATFFRILTSGGTAIVQGTVGTSGADMNLSTTTFSTGLVVSISSFTITEANA
jgi:hypothetical protein